MTVLFVPLFADRQGVPVDGKAGPRRSRLHDLHAFGDNLEPNVVAQQNSDLQAVTSDAGLFPAAWTARLPVLDVKSNRFCAGQPRVNGL
jgi:hypothetical protein